MALYLGTLGALSFVVLVLAVVGFGGGGSVGVVPVAAGVAVVGLGCVVASRVVVVPDDVARFVVALAFAEAPALVGFVGFVVTGSAVPYVVGLAFALPAMLRAEPAAA